VGAVGRCIGLWERVFLAGRWVGLRVGGGWALVELGGVRDPRDRLTCVVADDVCACTRRILPSPWIR
jgi:hypothetical protein